MVASRRHSFRWEKAVFQRFKGLTVWHYRDRYGLNAKVNPPQSFAEFFAETTQRKKKRRLSSEFSFAQLCEKLGSTNELGVLATHLLDYYLRIGLKFFGTLSQRWQPMQRSRFCAAIRDDDANAQVFDIGFHTKFLLSVLSREV